MHSIIPPAPRSRGGRPRDGWSRFKTPLEHGPYPCKYSLRMLHTLLNINYSTERQQLVFFAAQTLKHKLVVDYAQLDDNQVLGLRSTIWDILTKNPFSTPVKTQLCLGLAALLVQSTDYSLMHTIIQELLHNTDSGPACRSTCFLYSRTIG